ncbi:MAG: hypothetical protein ABI699_07385 [Caldimonas sp.]
MHTSCYTFRTMPAGTLPGAQQGIAMDHGAPVREYQESRIEDEPILGPVLAMPDGRVQRLTLLERILLSLRLTNAKLLEARYFKPARS